MRFNKPLVLTAALLAAGLFSSLTGCGRSATASLRPDIPKAEDLRKKLEAGGGGSSEAAAESTGTGWATLKGVFKLKAGDAIPTYPELVPNQDAAVCGKGSPIPNNALVVGSDRGIANIVVYAKAKRVHDSAKPLAVDNDVEPYLFDQKDCIFLSHVAAVQVNQKMTLKNSDPAPVGHNTKINPRMGLGVNANLAPGATSLFTPTKEESTPAGVSCSIHPFMAAYVLPRNDKYFAVTKPDGSFEIPNLPAGEEVELTVWHEKGTANGGLVLDRKDLKWNKGKFKVKLEADKPMELTLEVPATAFGK